ncbi:ABC transporter ATP-binding protein [Desulfitobacterium sp. AusDCA]|uniref:ABC transporter ATP-binding protein n=1 Tax=Desulfitobacterium sp. AusDCA TaxID=3240383 RepID=UPI003DA6FF9F
MKLECQKLCVSYNHTEMLHSADFSVHDGELVSLLGPSGCGKSTLLKTIAGLLPPDKGDILMDGKSIHQLPPYQRRTVIVFQDLRLFPNMNVEENIAFPLKIQGVNTETRLKEARKLLEKVQLGDLGKRKISQMSGGQLQRVALARALAAKPKVLLLDEPFSSLDESLRQNMRNLVVQLHKELGIATVLVTHNPQEALMISDRISVMFDGKIVQDDLARSLYQAPVNQSVADYFGEASYIEGRVVNGFFESRVISFPAAHPDGNYKAMFRPTALRLGSERGEYEITRIEFLGEHCHITLQYLGIRLLLSVSTSEDLQMGRKVSVEFDTTRAVLFKNG